MKYVLCVVSLLLSVSSAFAETNPTLINEYALIKTGLDKGEVSYGRKSGDLIGAMIAVGAQLSSIRYTEGAEGSCYAELYFKRDGKSVPTLEAISVGDLNRLKQNHIDFDYLCKIGNAENVDGD